MYQVAIVADHPNSCAGVEKLVTDVAGMAVVAAVGSVAELRLLGGEYDAVALDVPRVTLAAIDAVAELATLGPTLVSSEWDDSPSLLATIRSGARGCVSRSAQQTEVRSAIRVVAQGGFYLCPRMLGRFQVEVSGRAEGDSGGLAQREIETWRSSC